MTKSVLFYSSSQAIVGHHVSEPYWWWYGSVYSRSKLVLVVLIGTD